MLPFMLHLCFKCSHTSDEILCIVTQLITVEVFTVIRHCLKPSLPAAQTRIVEQCMIILVTVSGALLSVPYQKDCPYPQQAHVSI